MAGFLVGAAVGQAGPVMGGIGRAATYLGNLISPNEALTWEAYTNMFFLGLMTPENYYNQSRELGFNIFPVRPATDYRLFRTNEDGIVSYTEPIDYIDMNLPQRFIHVNKNLPSDDEALLMLNRGILGYNTTLQIITMNHNGERELAKGIIKLQDAIPGPSDLIAFAVRDCFSPDIVTTFQYNKELPTAILPYMKAQGLAGKIDLPMPPGSTTTEGNDNRTKPQWFDLYWWSHWQLPSVQQGFEMLQRLYPTSIFGPNPDIPENVYFSKDTLELLQKANDFPPYWRERLQTIAYLPLQKRDVKALYANGLLKYEPGDRSLFHAIKAHGYNDKDARRLSELVVKTAKPDITRFTLGQINSLYNEGVINEETAITALMALYYTRQEAQIHIKNLALQITLDELKFTVKILKRSFLQGDVGLDDVRSVLTSTGMTTEKTEFYIRNWEYELKTSHNFLNLSQSVDLYKKGLVSEQQLRRKLGWLHYREDEIELIVLNAKQDILLLRAKYLDKTMKQIDKENQRLIKEQERINKDAAKQLADGTKKTINAAKTLEKERSSPYSEKNLIAFGKNNYLTYGQIVKILTDKGWLLDAINTWIMTYTPDIKGIPINVKAKESHPVK